jgi:predicted dehydrogenase
MKVGIIGAGFMGSMHANIIKGITSVSLGGITAKTNARAGEIAARLGIPLYSNYREMLSDESIAIMDICAPTAEHARLALESLRAGKHVILEFPAFTDWRELEETALEAKRAKRNCAVAYYSRYQSQYKYLLDLAASGKIGKINSLYISRESSSVFSSEDILNNLVSQDIDFAVSLLGRPKAYTAQSVSRDLAAVVLTYESSLAVIEGKTNMPESYPFTSRHLISGDTGSLELLWRFTDRPVSQMRGFIQGQLIDLEAPDYDPYERELRVLLDGLVSGNVQGMDIESIRDSAAITFACRDLKGVNEL